MLFSLVIALLCTFGCQDDKEPVPKGERDISGIVTGPNGPEAGVWVIAETFDLPTRYAKIVVTDDHGKYLIPDLPEAEFDVWVRGYGLVDSPKEKASPGQSLNLDAITAQSPQEAAQYYPAGYWFSMVNVPELFLIAVPLVGLM